MPKHPNSVQLEPMADFFDARHDSYDEHMRKRVKDFQRFYVSIGSQIKRTKDRLRILDLGTGTGLEIPYILRKAPNSRIYCVDVSRQMLKHLLDNYPAYRKNLVLVQKSYLDYKLLPRSFDFVVSVMTMHHWEYETKLQLYKKILASLKKGGVYIEGDYVVDDKAEKKFMRIYRKLKKRHPDMFLGQFHIDIPFARKTMRRVFKEAGFTNVKVLVKTGTATSFIAS